MSLTCPDLSALGFVFLAIVFGVLNLWATIVVILAGHRYLKRTSTKPSAPNQDRN